MCTCLFLLRHELDFQLVFQIGYLYLKFLPGLAKFVHLTAMVFQLDLGGSLLCKLRIC